MPRFVLFDIDDTLFPSTEFSSLARKNAINAMISMGLDADYDSLAARLKAIIARRGSNYANHFDELCSELGIREPGRYVAAAVAAYHDTKTSIAPYPKVPLTLLTLRERGHAIYAATQGSSIKQWDKLIRLRLALYFRGVFVSEGIGIGKGPEFYLRVLEALGADAGDCLMVGDKEELDIAPAKAAGMLAARAAYGRPFGGPSCADYVLNDIGELPAFLETLGKAAD